MGSGTKRSVRIGLLTGSLLAAAAAQPAFAQAVGPDEAASGDTEIIVTAQKREQVLRDIPQSISVVSGAALERRQANDFKDYVGLVPGFSMQESTPGQARLILRGINTGGVSSTVAVYLDETPFGSSSGLINGGVLAGDFDTFDVSRIEVLRGPQGTLYGASSLGGVLKFVTNAPSTSGFEARVRANVESTQGGAASYGARGLVNIPLGDTLAVRASGFYRKDGGYIDSIGTAGSDVRKNINGGEVYGGRVSALLKASDTLTFRATAVLQNLNADANSLLDADPGTYKPLYGDLTYAQFIPEFMHTKYRVYSGVADWDVGFATVTSATSWATLDRNLVVDDSFALAGLIPAIFGVDGGVRSDQVNTIRKFTQEVRIASPKNDTLEWLVGGYYTRETGHLSQVITASDPLTDAVNPALPVLATVLLDSVYKEYAGFANATWHVVPRFDLTLGGRVSHNAQNAAQRIDRAIVAGVSYPETRSAETVVTYSVAPRFEISDHASIYARIAKGYRPGGPNLLPPLSPPGTPLTYKADSLISYEAGVKAETADHVFSLDLSAFYLDWSDVQLLAVINNTALNANGGKASSAGFEGSATLRPIKSFTVTFNAAYTDAHLREDTDAVVGGFAGDKLPYTPEWSGSVDAEYDFALGGSTNAYVGGNLRLVSRQTADFDYGYRIANGRQRRLPAYQAVDLRAGVDIGRFAVEAYVRNLTNARGITDAFSPTSDPRPDGATALAVIRPRTIGLSVTAGF